MLVMSGFGFRSPVPVWLESYFRVLLDAAPDAMLILDDQSRIALANRQTEKLFGYSASELVGQHLRVLVPACFQGEDAGHKERQSAPLSTGFDQYGLRSDGRKFPIEISLTPIHIMDRMMVISAIRDLTMSRRADEKFRAVLESAPDALVIADMGGRIALVNTQTEIMFGYERSELIGQPDELLIPERYRGQHARHREDFVRQSRVRPMGIALELSGLRKNGTEFPVEISLSPLALEHASYVISAIRDISERRKAEQQIEELQDELDEALRRGAAPS